MRQLLLYLCKQKNILVLCIYSLFLLLSLQFLSPPSCLAIIRISVSIFLCHCLLCACSSATAAPVYSGLIKHNKQRRSDKHGPQPIVSTLDEAHTFKCNKKARHYDFKCLHQAVITDIPLMHFRSGVLFPG